MRLPEDILFKDQHIIVCYKRAGLPVQTARLGEKDMVSLLKNYLKTPYLGVIHRLDQPVEGILVFARTRMAAAGLSRQNQNRKMGKYYYAVVLSEGTEIKGDKKQLTNYLKKEGGSNLSRVTEQKEEGRKLAVLRYQAKKTLSTSAMLAGQQLVWAEESTASQCTLLEIELETGRHHQIRVQLAYAGMPLLGDEKYGSEFSRQISKEMGMREVALCCCRIVLNHPASGKEMVFSIEPSGKAFHPFFQ